MRNWNLIIENLPLPGPWNMAVDEYFFLSLGPEPQTHVRFYQWERPTVSLGCSQVAEKIVDLDSCRRKGIDVVRRMTGGKLVLHHREVTYSICSSDVEVFSSTLAQSYRLISHALISGLKEMGLKARLAGPAPSFYGEGNFPCFSYPARDEVEIDGKKIIGSAQKRVGQKFLQHGSILLENEEELLRQALAPSEKIGRLRMVSLSEALGRPVSFDWAVDRLRRGIAGYFGITFNPKSFAPEETRIIEEIERTKYGTEEWTFGKRRAQRDLEY